jgi:hypothetical protein
VGAKLFSAERSEGWKYTAKLAKLYSVERSGARDGTEIHGEADSHFSQTRENAKNYYSVLEMTNIMH